MNDCYFLIDPKTYDEGYERPSMFLSKVSSENSRKHHCFDPSNKVIMVLEIGNSLKSNVFG